MGFERVNVYYLYKSKDNFLDLLNRFKSSVLLDTMKLVINMNMLFHSSYSNIWKKEAISLYSKPLDRSVNSSFLSDIGKLFSLVRLEPVEN